MENGKKETLEETDQGEKKRERPGSVKEKKETQTERQMFQRCCFAQ